MKVTPSRTILVACTASEYRSPVTAALLREALVSRGLWHRATIETAGTRAFEGSEPNPLAARALLERYGLDIALHRSRSLTDEMIARADLILMMSEEQRRHVFYRSPRALNKVFLLNELAGEGQPVRDPHASTMREYDAVNQTIAHLLELAMPALLQKLGLDDEQAEALLTEVEQYNSGNAKTAHA